MVLFFIFILIFESLHLGKVKNSSKEGIYVSLSFFDDIFIPSSNLQKPYRFDEKEQLFIWQYEAGDSVHDLFIDIGEEIRFRVVKESFLDTNPSGPPKKNDSNAMTSVVQKDEIKCPYTIIGSINEPGLGLLTWWKS